MTIVTSIRCKNKKCLSLGTTITLQINETLTCLPIYCPYCGKKVL